MCDEVRILWDKIKSHLDSNGLKIVASLYPELQEEVEYATTKLLVGDEDDKELEELLYRVRC